MEFQEPRDQGHPSAFSADCRPDIYHADSIQDALSRLFAWKKSASGGFSTRVLAKRLNMKSHSLLAMYARGERLPTVETLNSISAYFELSEMEFDFLVALLLYQKAKTPKEKQRLGQILARKRTCAEELILETDEWDIYERWYHIAILEMTRLKSFNPDPVWIASRLSGQVSPDMVEVALKKLLASGLMKQQPDGCFCKVIGVVKSKRRVTTLTMRSFQKQMLQRAATALDDQPVPERILGNLMLPFDSSDMDAAKEMVMNFIEKFQTRFDKPEGDSVYSLGAQFFQVAAPSESSKRRHLN